MKIFLVDDDDVFNYLNESIIKIETPEAEIQTFKSGEEVIDFLHSQPTGFVVPDIMLLDIRMPNMDGFELLEVLATVPENPFSKTDIYLLSSTLNEKDLERAKRYDLVKSFIGKPLTTDLYLTMLQERNRNI
jgi:CheY-like chemotaxis protein